MADHVSQRQRPKTETARAFHQVIDRYSGNAFCQRGEALHDFPGRDIRQQIADTAAIEERDEHGMPRLRG